MAIVAKRTKKGKVKKAVPEKPQSKFISQALVNRKKNAKGKKRKHPKTRGMVFVKNLPHGFFEEQLRGFFSQFGSITRLRLGRSKRTLKSRGYAFIEFRYPEVAEIAAEAINNYIMFKRIIKAKFIPPAEIRHDYFKSSIFKIRNAKGEKEFTSIHLQASKMNVEQKNRLMTDDDQKKRLLKITKKMNKKKQQFAELGMDYDLDAVASDIGVKLKSKEDMTIETLNDTALDGIGDETFDPEKLELNSDDEIEDFDGSEEDEESADEEIIKVLKEKAIQKAKDASKQKENVEKSVKVGEKKPAAKKVVEKPTKFEKTVKKSEKPVVTEKPAKVEVQPRAKSTRGKSKEAPVEEPPKALAKKPAAPKKEKKQVDKSPPKKIAEKPKKVPAKKAAEKIVKQKTVKETKASPKKSVKKIKKA